MHSEEWIYGLNPVLEALSSGRNVQALYVLSGKHEGSSHIRDRAEKRGIPFEVVERSFFDTRFPKGHQGVAARVVQKGYISLSELLMIPSKRNEPPLFIILDGIEDPRNLGAILRAADATGVHGIVIQSHRSARLSPEVAKASSGAVEYVPVSMVVNIKHAIHEMKDEGITVVGAEAGNHPVMWEIDLTVPLVLVIGSEGKGMRKTVMGNCDHIISLPMKGKINSLNVSVAAGVLLYETLRQRSLQDRSENPGVSH
jgi:23S rRNA (guanosine2251-2'-O)-methyltransferase